MFKKAFLAVALCLSTLALHADLTLQSMEYAEAQLLVQVNEAALNGSLLEKLFEQKQSEENDGKPAFTKQIEAILPPGVQGTTKFALAAGDANAPELPDMEKLDEDLTKVKFLGAFSFGASIQNLFAALPMLSQMVPEINEEVTLQSIQVEGYAGYRVTDKENSLKTLDVILSKDGRTALFGHKDMVAAAAAGKTTALPPALAAAKAANATDGFAVALSDPKHQDDLRASLESSSLEPISKAALGNIQTVALLVNSTPAVITLTIRGFFPDEPGAAAVRDNVLNTILIEGAKQIVPFFLPGTTFVDTLTATQKGNVAEITGTFTEADINTIITTLQNAVEPAFEIDEAEALEINDDDIDDTIDDALEDAIDDANDAIDDANDALEDINDIDDDDLELDLDGLE
jgi:hypothetical protein